MAVDLVLDDYLVYMEDLRISRSIKDVCTRIYTTVDVPYGFTSKIVSGSIVTFRGVLHEVVSVSYVPVRKNMVQLTMILVPYGMLSFVEKGFPATVADMSLPGNIVRQVPKGVYRAYPFSPSISLQPVEVTLNKLRYSLFQDYVDSTDVQSYRRFPILFVDSFTDSWVDSPNSVLISTDLDNMATFPYQQFVISGFGGYFSYSESSSSLFLREQSSFFPSIDSFSDYFNGAFDRFIDITSSYDSSNWLSNVFNLSSTIGEVDSSEKWMLVDVEVNMLANASSNTVYTFGRLRF